MRKNRAVFFRSVRFLCLLLFSSVCVCARVTGSGAVINESNKPLDAVIIHVESTTAVARLPGGASLQNVVNGGDACKKSDVTGSIPIHGEKLRMVQA